MVFGNRENVAIEICVREVADDWVFGRFLLWIDGQLIGDKQDLRVDLKGCINWLSKVIEKLDKKCAPELMYETKKIVWLNLVRSVFCQNQPTNQYPDAFSRFHITQIGMSSFDKYIIILINDGISIEKIYWQKCEEGIQDYTCPLGTVEAVAHDVILWFREKKY